MQEPDACLEDVEDINASNLLEIEEGEETTPIRREVSRHTVSKAM